MPETTALKFFSDQLFAGDVGIVDHDSAVIKGVSLIKTGEAEGHGLTVDDETIKQLQACAKKKNKVPVQLDHGSGISATIGYVTNFRVDKDKLRADLHLLQTHEETPTLLERAETMSELFGLSVAFKGPQKGVPIGGGKMGARCEKLLSVDLVTRPAANDGLFSVPSVDTEQKGMAKEITQAPAKEPTLADLMAKIEEISTKQAEFEQFIVEGRGANDPTLEDLDAMSDDELSALGVTRAEVNSAIEEALADAGIGDPADADKGKGAEEVVASGAEPAAAAAVASGAEAPATFQALTKRLVELETKLAAKEAAEKKSAEDHELSEIEGKIVQLAGQRDEFKTKFETIEAENQALRLAVRTGTRPVKAGVDNGVRMFGTGENGQLHEFQVRVKQLEEGGKSSADAIRFAQKENPALHADWVQSQGKKKSE